MFAAETAKLTSKRRFERERGVREIHNALKEKGQEAAVQDCVQQLIVHICSCEDRWESRHGGLTTLAMYVRWLYIEAKLQSPNFLDEATKMCLKLLSDSQVVVRMAAGDALAALCQVGGVALYDRLVEEPLIASIEENMFLERDENIDPSDVKVQEKLLAGEAATQEKKEAEEELLKPPSAKDDITSLLSSVASSKSSVFHDTAGWKSLETDVKCLQSIMDACQEGFAPKLTEEVMDLICQCAVHTNRFVRGISFKILCSVFDCTHAAGTLEELAAGSDVVTRLASGISDEWSEVRMDASIAVRHFLHKLQPAARLKHYDILLPGMCINRYYIAEGVRIFSQVSWRTFAGQGGKELVVQFLPSIVPYYIAHTEVHNYEMREAACHCIGELMAKIDAGAVAVYAPRLLEALVEVLHGSTWPVRIAAATASARAMEAFPSVCRPKLGVLYEVLRPLLSDKTWSVREEAARTLGAMVRCFGAQECPQIMQLAVDGLDSVRAQQDDYKKYASQCPEDLKVKHDNDVKLHTDQQMIACCSAGAQPDGTKAEEHQHEHEHDDSHRWETTDGALYLLRELSASLPAEVEKVLPKVAEVTSLRQYMRHSDLLQTLWKVLPVIAKNIGKKPFKRHLEPFFDAMVYSLSRQCTNSHTKNATVACIKELVVFVGPMIFVGRVEQHNPMYLEEMAAHVPMLKKSS